MNGYLVPPATASKIISTDTPEWDAALAAHHHALVKAGVTAWADEGKKLATPPRPRAPRKKKPTPASSTT